MAPEEKVSQHSRGAVYLDLSVGAINSCLREAFLEIIRLRYVVIELRFYRTLPYERDGILQERLDYYFKCRKAAALMTTMNTFANKFSIVRIDIEQGRLKARTTAAITESEEEVDFTGDVGRRSLFPSSRTVFLTVKMEVLLMCHVLQQ